MATSSGNGGSSSQLSRIAEDQLLSILLLLPLKSIFSFGSTCRRYKILASADSLWESICRRELGHQHVDALIKDSRKIKWKRLYQQIHQLNSVHIHRLLCGNEDGQDDNENFPCPRPRASHSLNFVSGYLVLFGGGCEGGRHLDDTWIAHVGGDNLGRKINWQKTNSGIPNGRFGHSCVVLGNNLVLFGGINDNGIRQSDTWIGHLVFDEQYGHVTLSWRLLDTGTFSTTQTPSPRGAHAACPIDNRSMLIHGGIGPYGLRLCDSWVLDLTQDVCFGTWRRILPPGPSPPSRSGHSLTHIGGTQTILFGGRGLGYEVLNDVWLFDSSDLSWVQLAFDLSNIPLPRVGHSAHLIIGQKLLIYGGEDSNRCRKDDFWVLNIGSLPMQQSSSINCWKLVESTGYKPKRRSFQGACIDDSGCNLYVHGGMVDGLVQPAGSNGLRFDGEIFLVDLVFPDS